MPAFDVTGAASLWFFADVRAFEFLVQKLQRLFALRRAATVILSAFVDASGRLAELVGMTRLNGFRFSEYGPKRYTFGDHSNAHPRNHFGQ
jgi:hypothetical protein